MTKSGAFMLGALTVSTLTLGFQLATGNNPAQLHHAMKEAVRCAIVWDHSHTTADTLAAIRQHCPEVSR
jgi:hypothetical protein